jgi:uncharacterized protein
MRVVLDTNVLVRATGQSNGPAREVFLRLLEPPHVLVASKFLFDELRRVLNYPRVQSAHGLSSEKINRHLADIVSSADIVDLPATLAASVPADPDDDPIAATAVYGRADVLCTRDQHLRESTVAADLDQFQIRVMTDIELLEELRALDR